MWASCWVHCWVKKQHPILLLDTDRGWFPYHQGRAKPQIQTNDRREPKPKLCTGRKLWVLHVLGCFPLGQETLSMSERVQIPMRFLNQICLVLYKCLLKFQVRKNCLKYSTKKKYIHIYIYIFKSPWFSCFLLHLTPDWMQQRTEG